LKNKFFIVLFIFFSLYLNAQTSEANKLMETGLNNFSRGNYTLALGDFREIILNSEYEVLHGTSYYWIARSYMAQNLLDKAENNLDFFIRNYSENKLYPDAIYQKARLLFRKSEYDNSIQIFYKFIESYPEHSFVSNSYFWIAESLYNLGHLEEARIIYAMIIREFPNSFKLDASNYKLSLITLKFRENELLKLLKISHEEYLKALDEFQRREKTYELTIGDYQRKLLAASSDEDKELLSEMSDIILEKDNLLSTLNNQITKLNGIIEKLDEQLADAKAKAEVEPVLIATETKSFDSSSSKSKRLLELKNSALILKEFYINWLASQVGE
jgi:outer membrane protein assembly factor BamD (BamD/ComL family)